MKQQKKEEMKNEDEELFKKWSKTEFEKRQKEDKIKRKQEVQIMRQKYLNGGEDVVYYDMLWIHSISLETLDNVFMDIDFIWITK